MVDSPVMEPRIDPDDELTCLGHDEDLDNQQGAMAPPIVQTSLFAFPSTDALMRGLDAEDDQPVYSRGTNPTVRAVETKLARLERGEACTCFASGMAAISATMFGLLKAGDHLLFVNQVYGPSRELARALTRFGVAHNVALDITPDAVEAHLRPNTKMVWIESPGTMVFRQLDVRAVADLARAHGAVSVVDNSWATPLFQKPLTLGVDVVVHSASKYLGGHSDVLSGAVISDGDRIRRLFYDATLLLGGMLSPFDAWLLNRGLRTLPARLRVHHANGLTVARWLADQPRVRRVFHPLLDTEGTSRPRSLGAQLRGATGLFSFELDTDGHTDVARVLDALTRFRLGVSWGGVESLALTPNRDDRQASALDDDHIPRGTIRLSIGLEPPEILIDDLRQALAVS